MKGTYDYQTT